jgi:hypothetical protein
MSEPKNTFNDAERPATQKPADISRERGEPVVDKPDNGRTTTRPGGQSFRTNVKW